MNFQIPNAIQHEGKFRSEIASDLAVILIDRYGVEGKEEIPLCQSSK